MNGVLTLHLSLCLSLSCSLSLLFSFFSPGHTIAPIGRQAGRHPEKAVAVAPSPLPPLPLLSSHPSWDGSVLF